MDALTSDDLLLGFYGDDFTGSTDAMAGLAGRACGRAVHRATASDKSPENKNLRAVGCGCAGRCRPEEMAQTGQRLLEAERVAVPIGTTRFARPSIPPRDRQALGGPSTSGLIGSRRGRFPLALGAPDSGRIACLGNLFARSGLQSEPYRLDRHPTMAGTPYAMTESDVASAPRH